MKGANVFISFLFCLFVQNVQSQTQIQKVYITDKKGENYAYVNVTKTYERIAEKGYKSVDLFQKLGNIFYAEKNMPKAAKWYGELFSLTYDLDISYYHQYAKALNAIGDIEKANFILEKLKIQLITQKL